MKEYFFCSKKLLENVEEIKEIDDCLNSVQWQENFTYVQNGKKFDHQTA
jgi:hypothetical protein